MRLKCGNANAQRQPRKAILSLKTIKNQVPRHFCNSPSKTAAVTSAMDERRPEARLGFDQRGLAATPSPLRSLASSGERRRLAGDGFAGPPPVLQNLTHTT